ncbi:MAG: VOC family protein [Chloroflexi bacterium]|nr:VOC family protein [Chloroflexota bacterium]
MITGFNHSGFVVRDMEKMVEFYRDALGLTVLREVSSVAPPEGDHTGVPGARRALVFVGKPGEAHQLELVQFIEPASPDHGHLKNYYLGAAHVCFNVDDLATLCKDLKARGIQFVTEPILRKTPDGKTRGIVYAMDPEGNYLEFIQPPM